MTLSSATPQARRLGAAEAPRLARLLEEGFAPPGQPRGMLAHQYLLDALDRGEHGRFLIWPGEGEPLAVVYAGPAGTVVPAGDPAAAQPLAQPVEQSDWRVLIGDAPLCRALLVASAGPRRRRPYSAREQRFMVRARGADDRGLWQVPLEQPEGLRTAVADDLDVLAEYAAQLHVEDRMGPPLGRSGRQAVRSRMLDSIRQGAAWVIERGGVPVAKLEVSLRSERRGAQIAGVYVPQSWRDRGLATALVRAVTLRLLAEGLPGVTLHVRANNPAGIAAYQRAGFADEGAWLLALR